MRITHSYTAELGEWQGSSSFGLPFVIIDHITDGILPGAAIWCIILDELPFQAESQPRVQLEAGPEGQDEDVQAKFRCFLHATLNQCRGNSLALLVWMDSHIVQACILSELGGL